MNNKSAKLKIGIICGGPSLERGISLNSARSMMDHLESAEIEIVPFYFDSKRRPYKISKAQLYSNTPSDFDFKLHQTATFLTKKMLIDLLKDVDIVFPIMHGPFGEDGKIQSILEKNGVPFVGSGSKSCSVAFDKFKANEFVGKKGFFTLPSIVLQAKDSDHKTRIEEFFKNHKLKRAIVKPASGGSSIGVFSVTSAKEALEKSRFLFAQHMDRRVVVEQFARGIEFTMVVLENHAGLPVALPPTEIETDYTENQIFDFRKKYLPTRQVTWHCPPRFDDETIEKIQAQGEQIFSLLGMRDFGRFDGWMLPDSHIWFCDFNPISGMEQNSFLFQQASRVGMTHNDVLRYIVRSACNRYKINFQEIIGEKLSHRKRVNILMGGDNSERQVSLMSGTNVWLKLRRSKRFHPQPFLLDMKKNIWKLPYQLCLNHTVEEIANNCESFQKTEKRLASFEDRARLRLGIAEEKNKEEFFAPQKLTSGDFLRNSDFVFIALHGGDGENGNMQEKFDSEKIKYNGPGEETSRLCIDKWKTSTCIKNLNIEGIDSIPGKIIQVKDILKKNDASLKVLWEKLKVELDAQTLIVKPRADGCTTGIVHLFSSNDLKKYIWLLKKQMNFAPKGTFKGQFEIIEMPTKPPSELLVEKFMETDILWVKDNKLNHRHRTDLIEITVGVVEKNGKLKAFNPSITIAEGEVLTVEEKFQGGTGVNITPPPSSVMSQKVLKKIKNSIKKVSEKIGIRGYSRIDAFANVKTGDLLIIEVNTLPGLTGSTVFYHQGLTENPPILPRELLELLIQNKGY